MRRINWFEKKQTGLYQFKTTCTSARNIALDQNKLNQFKIILNLNYNINKPEEFEEVGMEFTSLTFH